MNRKHLIFLHGFASSGQGAKAQFLRQKCYALPDVEFHAIDFNPTPRDFEFMTVTGMINRLAPVYFRPAVGKYPPDWQFNGRVGGAQLRPSL